VESGSKASHAIGDSFWVGIEVEFVKGTQLDQKLIRFHDIWSSNDFFKTFIEFGEIDNIVAVFIFGGAREELFP
jgi:hypothetical protein